MSEQIDQDLAIIYSRSAIAGFIAAVAGALLTLEATPEGASAGDIFRKHLVENLRKAATPNAPRPMTDEEREELRRYYRVFRAFYQDPNRLENLPPDATQH